MRQMFALVDRKCLLHTRRMAGKTGAQTGTLASCQS